MALDQILTWQPLPENVDHAVGIELRFIADWQSGKVPFLGAITRVRQVHRAFPWLLDHQPSELAPPTAIAFRRTS